MTASRGFANNEYYNGMSFHNLDEVQPPKKNFIPISLRSYEQEYQPQELGNGEKQQTFKSEGSTIGSKGCLIGFGIAVVITIVVALAISVPLGVVSRCGPGVISSTPNWIGTYLLDNGCDPTQCCCFTNQISLNQPSSNVLQITNSVTGQCTGLPSTIVLTLPLPTIFQTLITWAGDPIRVQLGQDNSYLSFVDLNRPYCSSTAVRTSFSAGSMKSMNLGLVMFILLITIGIMK